MYTILLVYSSVSILMPGALGFCKNMDYKVITYKKIMKFITNIIFVAVHIMCIRVCFPSK